MIKGWRLMSIEKNLLITEPLVERGGGRSARTRQEAAEMIGRARETPSAAHEVRFRGRAGRQRRFRSRPIESHCSNLNYYVIYDLVLQIG